MSGGRLALAMLAGSAVLANACGGPARVEHRWAVMGTYASAEVYATNEGVAERIVEDVRRSYERVDGLMSNWRSDSGISRINEQAAKEPSHVDDLDLYRCIKIALEYARFSDGAFDPTVGPLVRLWGFRPGPPRVPSPEEIALALGHVGWQKVLLMREARAVRFLDAGVELDLGAIGKGYALDVAARNFAVPGSRAGLLDLGGSLYAWRSPPGEKAWRIGLRSPEDESSIMATVEVSNRSLATSGAYENSFVKDAKTYGHILDPKTGSPADSDVLSATVITDGATDSDAMSTAMFVAGSRRSAEFLSKLRRVEAVLLVRERSGTVLLASGSLKGRLTLDPSFAPRVGGSVRFLLPPVELD